MKNRTKTNTPTSTEAEHLRTILNCVADGVFTVDIDKKITFFNRAAERITGFKASEAVGQHCYDIFKASACGGNCTLDRVKKTNRQIVNQSVSMLNKKGSTLTVSISAASLKNEKREIIGGVETFRDLSVEEELRRKIDKSYSFHDIVSKDVRMHDIFAILPDIAESNVSVLIEGESGTGKELLARAIHNLSPRKNKPFVAVNMGSLPDTLLESELFGYKKGAFTDARKDKPGRFDMAKGGTLFLDEIGDISPALQVRLLRVLQEKTFEPLGGVSPVETDVRIVAATNKQLHEEVQKGEFRDDLYYRLKVLRLELPPLRERRCDIPILADHIRRELNAETGKSIEQIDDSVINLFMDYDFPGNIRELHNIMQHAFVLCKGNTITVKNLPTELAAIMIHDDNGRPLSLNALEVKTIREALSNNDGNKVHTARQLGINPSTLYRKMKRYGIKAS